MKKWLTAGTFLLIVQLALAVMIHSTDRDYAAFTPHADLLDFSPPEVDAITIVGEESEVVHLHKINGRWLLPDEKFNAPADAAKIEEFLERLAGLKQGLIVATTREAAQRFKVSEDAFQRHIILKKGAEQVAELFLGTSPSFKMVHARVGGRGEIVSVPLQAHAIETEYDSWLDRGMVRVERDALMGVTVGDLRLIRKEKDWMPADLGGQEAVNTAKINELVDRITGLTVEGIVDPEESDRVFAQARPLTITLILEDNTRKIFSFARREKANQYIMKSSDHDYSFLVNNTVVDGIAEIKRTDLVSPKEAGPNEADSGEAPLGAEKIEGRQ